MIKDEQIFDLIQEEEKRQQQVDNKNKNTCEKISINLSI